MSGPGAEPWFLTRDGSRPLIAGWDAGPFAITAETLESDVATGTAPLVVASTTVVPNLNADMLDGQHAAAFSTTGHVHTALSTTYDNATASLFGFTATEVQTAIDDLAIADSVQAFDINALQSDVGANTVNIADLVFKHRVQLLKDNSTIALTATPTKVLVGSATLVATGGVWELFDSGSGSVDSLRYTGTPTIALDCSCNFNPQHSSADVKPLEFRALCYVNDTIQNGGHVYGNTSTLNNSIVTCERTMRITLTTNQYINYRAAYINASAGASITGQIPPFGYQLILWEI